MIYDLSDFVRCSTILREDWRRWTPANDRLPASNVIGLLLVICIGTAPTTRSLRIFKITRDCDKRRETSWNFETFFFLCPFSSTTFPIKGWARYQGILSRFRNVFYWSEKEKKNHANCIMLQAANSGVSQGAQQLFHWHFGSYYII